MSFGTHEGPCRMGTDKHTTGTMDKRKDDTILGMSICLESPWFRTEWVVNLQQQVQKWKMHWKVSYISTKYSTYIKWDACRSLKGLIWDHTKMTAPLTGWIVKSQKLQGEVKPQQGFIAKGLMSDIFQYREMRIILKKMIRIMFGAPGKVSRSIIKNLSISIKYFI